MALSFNNMLAFSGGIGQRANQVADQERGIKSAEKMHTETADIDRARLEESKRQHDMTTWVATRDKLLTELHDDLGKYLPGSSDYEKRINSIKKIIGLRPGDQGGLQAYQDARAHLDVDPEAANALTPPKPQPQGTPGPGGVGQVPGGDYKIPSIADQRQQAATNADPLGAMISRMQGAQPGQSVGQPPVTAPTVYQMAKPTGPPPPVSGGEIQFPFMVNQQPVNQRPNVSAAPASSPVQASGPIQPVEAQKKTLDPSPSIPSITTGGVPDFGGEGQGLNVTNRFGGEGQGLNVGQGNAYTIPPVPTTPVQATAQVAQAAGTTPDRIQMYLDEFNRTGNIPLWAFKMIEPLVSKRAAQQYDLNVLAPQRVKAVVDFYGGMDKVPPHVREQMALEMNGWQYHNQPGAAYLPQILSQDEPGARAPVGQMDTAGNPIIPTSHYRVTTDPGNPNGQRWTERAPQGQAGTNSQGQTEVFDRRQLGPVVGTNGQPMVNPSTLPTKVESTVTQNQAGGSSTSRQTSKVLPGGSTAPVIQGINQGAPPPANQPSTGGASLNPGNLQVGPKGVLPYEKARQVAPFDPSTGLDWEVLQLAQDPTKYTSLKGNDAHRTALNRRMAELGVDLGTVTNAIKERAGLAKKVLGHMDEIDQIINDADKAGELGVLASRWNDFLAGKVGIDTTKSQVFSRLRTNQEFLQTAVSMAHGGLRGGSSPQMIEHWEKALQAKDPATLKAKLNEARGWMRGYASFIPTREEAIKSINSGSGGAGTSVDEKYKKVLSGLGPGRHTLSDHTVWEKQPDGTISQVK